MFIPLHKLTRRELEARERYHVELARLYDRHAEHDMATSCLESAAVYRVELEKRPAEQETPEESRSRERREAAMAALKAR